MMMLTTIVISISIFIALKAKVGLKKARWALRTTCRDSDAMSKLIDWRKANPHQYIGESKEGRRLVLECISAWNEFLLAHPNVKDMGHRKFLVALLYEGRPPDPPPPKKERIPERPRKTGAVSFYQSGTVLS